MRTTLLQSLYIAFEKKVFAKRKNVDIFVREGRSTDDGVREKNTRMKKLLNISQKFFHRLIFGIHPPSLFLRTSYFFLRPPRYLIFGVRKPISAMIIVPINVMSNMVFISRPGRFTTIRVVASQITIIDIAVHGYFIICSKRHRANALPPSLC